MITKKRQNSRFFVNFVEKALIPIKFNEKDAAQICAASLIRISYWNVEVAISVAKNPK
jgi:hypothetical protein